MVKRKLWSIKRIASIAVLVVGFLSLFLDYQYSMGHMINAVNSAGFGWVVPNIIGIFGIVASLTLFLASLALWVSA